jgi:glutathione S-transferase
MSTSDQVPAALHNPTHAESAKQYLAEHLDILERHLSDRRYVLGNQYSLVDLVVACTVGYGVMCGAELAGRPRVKAWLEEFQSRPAFKAEWT